MAPTGQPVPQKPSDWQPVTLRRVTSRLQPSFPAPSQRTLLFSLAASMGQGAMERRCSTASKWGARDCSSSPDTPKAWAQWRSTRGGVRKLVVQLTSVPPPTPRPCSTVMARSAVARMPRSW